MAKPENVTRHLEELGQNLEALLRRKRLDAGQVIDAEPAPAARSTPAGAYASPAG
jgi:hypothetical protein